MNFRNNKDVRNKLLSTIINKLYGLFTDIDTTYILKLIMEPWWEIAFSYAVFMNVFLCIVVNPMLFFLYHLVGAAVIVDFSYRWHIFLSLNIFL